MQQEIPVQIMFLLYVQLEQNILLPFQHQNQWPHLRLAKHQEFVSPRQMHFKKGSPYSAPSLAYWLTPLPTTCKDLPPN